MELNKLCILRQQLLRAVEIFPFVIVPLKFGFLSKLKDD